MDAYYEDSHDRRGPDGSKGARLPDDGTLGHEPPGADGQASGPSVPGAAADEPPAQGAEGKPAEGVETKPAEGREGEPADDAVGDEPPAVGRAAVESSAAGSHPAGLPLAAPDLDADADAEQPVAPTAPPRTGVAALSPRYQFGAAVALAAVAVTACVHLGMVFLSLAPANTVTKQHGKAIEDWVYPEFEQNWKLFAPNPLQQNIAVQVRAEVRTKDGDLRTTGWRDLSARDGAAIDGNLLPSHTQQNELRRAWDFLVATHGTDNRPVGLRGALSETYMRRIVTMRLNKEDAIGREGVVQRVQVRSRTTNVQPPVWSRERFSSKPVYRVLPWWTVTADEAAGGVA
ncbi:DUF5819 family protein [Streptomyces sp. NPDC101171]|uniref:DUF5819 family protein n=1 Tax=Streptomyces sp. NPDC101171 TaxID=3366122 RepID=UPI0038216108